MREMAGRAFQNHFTHDALLRLQCGGGVCPLRCLWYHAGLGRKTAIGL